MPNFIKDNTSLAAAKSNFQTRPDVPATKKVTKEDWNEMRQALLDIQAFCREQFEDDGDGTWVPVGGGGGGGMTDAQKRTLAASTRLQLQMGTGFATVVISEGDPAHGTLGNLLSGAGPHNNVAPDVNGGDPNTFGAPYFPLAFEGADDATLTGLVSVDSGAGWTSATADPSPYGSGACIIQNLSSVASLTLVDQSTSSTEANRLDLDGDDVVIPPLGMALLLYNTTDSRWNLITPS